jgi:CubicO group peptidase (beta-lactamase class C family)
MYSNTNYCLLASIVEKVSGKSFSEYLKQEIFSPLQMNDSYVLTDKPKIENVAKAYTHGFAALDQDYLDGVVGDKGICASVADLYKFHLALKQGVLLKKETLAEAYKPRSFEKKGDKNYGYGWRMKKQDAGDYIIYHNGWWRGFNTLFFRRLSDNTVVIILNNKLNKGIYRITPILEILDGMKSEFDSEDERSQVTINYDKNSKA